MEDVLSMNYLPCMAWMRVFLAQNCVIDVHENFVKQTYRNRCLILSSNGVMPLTIPIKKTTHKTTVINLEPDNTVNWQKQHWESLKTAYGSSPYFIHYAPYFEPIYSQPTTSVVEFEIALLKLIIKLLKQPLVINLSEVYITPNTLTDYRNSITPKQQSVAYFKPYHQVFSSKFGFIPNLSIIDALFNIGPHCTEHILAEANN